jgi:Phospholipase_D-nuclease N-terminal
MRYLPMILLVVLAIYCWVEIAMSDRHQVRQLTKGIWALLVFVPLAGPLAWLAYGRPNGSDVTPAAPRPRPQVLAPDDDPDFLRSLKRPPRPPRPPEDA